MLLAGYTYLVSDVHQEDVEKKNGNAFRSNIAIAIRNEFEVI
jgi:hypothetical protein